jgi:predicted Zn-dependent protease
MIIKFFQSMNKFSIYAAVLVLFILYGCSVVPITGRKQVNLLPESDMISMGLTSYQEFMNENPPSSDKANTSIVKEVGNNIAMAVQQFFAGNNMQSRLSGYQWEFSLVDSKDANAFCLPGGKVVVYKGILPYTVDRTGLAVVISHEIAHAVARHGNERMSQEMLVQLGGMALGTALKNKPEQTQNIFLSAYGMGSQVGVLLPYSREHELEADKLGLIFMAMAGYNPQTAISFWERMSSSGGTKPPEFLSTHPSDATRINNIRANMPEIMKYYKK